MNIMLGQGIKDFRFGMALDEIEELLGQPDQIREDSENEWIDYQYDNLNTTFRFYRSEKDRLGWIETENPDITLFGKRLINLEKTKVLELMRHQGYDLYEIDEDYSFDTIMYEDVWLEFEYTYNTVYRVNFGVLIAKNGEYEWPLPSSFGTLN